MRKKIKMVIQIILLIMAIIVDNGEVIGTTEGAAFRFIMQTSQNSAISSLTTRRTSNSQMKRSIRWHESRIGEQDFAEYSFYA